jgi:hypothetical protein
MKQATEFHTFEEMVSVLAINAPHALILGEWRRLEQAINEYCSMHGVQRKSWMSVLANDLNVGQEVVDQINALRLRRNEIAHEKTKPVAPNEAAEYAKKVHDLIWLLADAHQTPSR